MKAVVFRKSEGLVVAETPKPVPEPGQVLIRVSDAGFCGSDHSLVKSAGLPDGYILGHEISGVVEAVGPEAEGPEIGSRVIIRPTFCGDCPDCRQGKQQFCQQGRRTTGIGDLPGGFAEYLVAYPPMLIPVPEGVDSQNAALAEAFAASLHGINQTGRDGGSALVIGGGPIGLALVRLLKLKGFGPVLLSEPVAEKRELGLAFGADEVLDPFNQDLVGHCFLTTGGRLFDTVFECSGVPSNVQTGLDLVGRFGVVCVLSVMYQPAPISPMLLNFKEVWLTGAYGNTHQENIWCLEMMSRGLLDGRPMITDLIALDDLPRVYADRIEAGTAVKVMMRIGPEF